MPFFHEQSGAWIFIARLYLCHQHLYLCLTYGPFPHLKFTNKKRAPNRRSFLYYISHTITRSVPKIVNSASSKP